MFRFELPKFRPGKQVFGGDQAQTQPLSICTACKHVLCGCGNCHSQQCNKECLYTSEESTYIAQANAEMSENLRNMLATRLPD